MTTTSFYQLQWLSGKGGEEVLLKTKEKIALVVVCWGSAILAAAAFVSVLSSVESVTTRILLSVAAACITFSFFLTPFLPEDLKGGSKYDPD